jgi:hypothetical protein
VTFGTFYNNLPGRVFLGRETIAVELDDGLHNPPYGKEIIVAGRLLARKGRPSNNIGSYCLEAATWRLPGPGDGWRNPDPNWQYRGKLHDAVAKADRVVVRDGGFDCCGPVDNEDVLFEVANLSEIQELHANLKFEEQQTRRACMCCGFPGIDWYRGKDRLALAAVQHGKAIRWKGCPGDMAMTRESSEWLVAWLTRHGVNKTEIERGCGGPRRDAKRRAAKAGQPQRPPAADHPGD